MKKCVIVNCPNITGIPFPSDEEEKCEWFAKLELLAQPDESAVVCLDHFVESNLTIRRNGDNGNVCRLCTVEKDVEKSIDETIGKESLSEMIMTCCYPMIISDDDGLPDRICAECLDELQIAYNFRKKCLKVNELWWELKAERHAQKRKRDELKAKSKRIRTENNCPDKDEAPNDLNPKDVPDASESTSHEKNEHLHEGNETINNELNGQEVKCADDKVSISKTIVTRQKKYESTTGVHSCVLTHGLQKSTFVVADGYLFTFGLLKGNTRHLRCVLPNCKAKAEQMLVGENLYEDKITVRVSHSHKAPNERLQKKHMFFHVMRKRMHHDKTLNIRSIYEEVCQQQPELREIIPLRNVINEICRYQVPNKLPQIASFEEFYENVEGENCEKIHFTISNRQFYQERFRSEDGAMAVVFCNTESIEMVSHATLMYVDASFKIDTLDEFKYQLITVLVWIDQSYYPILFALVNRKTQELLKKIFEYLHDVLAPDLRPHEIVTDYEANLYYALGEIYLESHIGGSVFYYTQNLYKKICLLNLARDLEVNSGFRNLYHMMLMLPLLPVNTITDALNNIEVQAKEMDLSELTRPIIEHIQSQWIRNVTPEMFCVHRLENRINENVIAPFKKFRDYLLLFKGRPNQTAITITQVVEKLIELESFLNDIYNKSDKKSFSRDLTSFQKKNVIKAWQYIETHPKININNFFQRVLGYIKCMENQLWIWGFYRHSETDEDVLISATNCQRDDREFEEAVEDIQQDQLLNEGTVENPTIVMEAVIDDDGGVVLQSNEMNSGFEKTFFKYIQYQ